METKEGVCTCGAAGSGPKCECWAMVNRLYGVHFAKLVRMARRHVWSDALAEEAVQEAFVKFRTVGHRCAPGSEVVYLRSMAINNARSIARRRARRDHLTELRQVAVVRLDVSAEDQCMTAVESEVLHTALQALPERQQQVMTMRYIRGLSERETAEALDIAPGSVKAHASRGRENMRQSLALTA